MIPASIMLILFLNVFVPQEKTEPVNSDNADVSLLYKVFIDSDLCYEYTYNTAKLISEEKSKYRYIKHNYNTKNQLVSTDYYEDLSLLSNNSRVVETAHKRQEWVTPDNTAISNHQSFEYNDKGQVIKSTDHLCYFTYNYDKNDRISRQTCYHQDKISGYIDYSYDNKGNLIKKSGFEVFTSGDSQLTSTYEYKFDNKFNPFRSFKSLMIPGENTNINNVTKEIYTVHFMVDHVVNDKQIKEYSYEYNEKGCPVRVNMNIEYFYK